MEKRGVSRRRVLKRVRVSFLDGACAVDCLLRNDSDAGAYIEITDGLLIPDLFTLHNEMDQYKVDCEVVRRVGKTVGVKFVGEKVAIDATRVQVINMLNDANSAQANEPAEDVEALSAPPDAVETYPRPTLAPPKSVAFGKKGQ